MRYTIIFVVFFIFSINAQNTAIGSNEKLTYSASYNMSGILNDIAEVTMETSPIKVSDATLLRLKCTAATYSKWDNFFRIRDLYESYVSPKSITPVLYKRDVNEGGYYKNEKYTFNYKTKTIKSETKKKKNFHENKTVPISANAKDIVSTIYSMRLIDFKKLAIGQKKFFTIVFDNEEIKGYFKYLGTETINTAIGKKTCYKIAVGSTNNNSLQGTNSNFLWLTADMNKIPVYGKFKIPVGTGELKIKSATGLKS